MHGHFSSFPNHQAHKIGVTTARRHEVDEENRAVRRVETSLDDQGVATVTALGDAGPNQLRRRKEPPSVLGST